MGGFKLKNLLWEGYGYFLEQHIVLMFKLLKTTVIRKFSITNSISGIQIHECTIFERFGGKGVVRFLAEIEHNAKTNFGHRFVYVC